MPVECPSNRINKAHERPVELESTAFFLPCPGGKTAFKQPRVLAKDLPLLVMEDLQHNERPFDELRALFQEIADGLAPGMVPNPLKEFKTPGKARRDALGTVFGFEDFELPDMPEPRVAAAEGSMIPDADLQKFIKQLHEVVEHLVECTPGIRRDIEALTGTVSNNFEDVGRRLAKLWALLGDPSVSPLDTHPSVLAAISTLLQEEATTLAPEEVRQARARRCGRG